MCLFSLNKLIITIASLRDRASLNGKGRITISKSQRTVTGDNWPQEAVHNQKGVGVFAKKIFLVISLFITSKSEKYIENSRLCFQT